MRGKEHFLGRGLRLGPNLGGARSAGDLTDDPSLHREGRQEERKGEAKDELAEAHDKADRKAEEVANLERKT